VAIVHRTTLTPTKIELLTAWLPAQEWYRGTGTPVLTKAGGFRLDDPAGEVGIELMIVTDAASPEVAAYLVPLTYRAEAFDGELVGTMDHGVLGKRFAYDGPTDPVFVAQVAALVRGEVEPQAQSESDTADRTVHVETQAGATEILRHLVPGSAGAVTASWTDADGTRQRAAILGTDATGSA
jgi:hypothetical protein